MTVFEFGTDMHPKDRVSARFLGSVHRKLAVAFFREKKKHAANDIKLTQQRVATTADLNRAFVSRMLSGAGNPTLRTLAEICYGMGLRPEIQFIPVDELSQNDGHQSTPTTSTTNTSLRVAKSEQWQNAGTPAA